MSLERKDVRLKVSPELHQAITALADIDRVDIAELCEQILERAVMDRVHAAHRIADRVPLFGKIRE